MSQYHVRTRARTIALATPITHTLRICTEKSINTHLSTATHNKDFASGVETLDISMASILNSDKINHLIMRTNNLTALSLYFPVKLKSTMLRNIHLPLLSYFSTNLHHRLVVGFISRNPSIISITLATCGTSVCPITYDLCPNLREIIGTSACISSIVRENPVSRVIARDTTTSEVLRALVQALASSTVDILVFQLQFSPLVPNILRSVITATPQVSTLKLVDIADKSDETFRPWDDIGQWSNDLRELRRLKTLILSTSSPLVADLGALSQERRLVRRWSQDSGEGNLQLDRIFLYQRTEGMGWHGGGGYASRWARQAWRWNRLSFLKTTAL